MEVDIRDLHGCLYFDRAAYEPATTRFLAERLRPGDVFVDVGANSGYFTLLADASVGPGGRVCAFEPNEPLCAMIGRSLARNALADRVTVENMALTRADGQTLRLYVSRDPGNLGISSLHPWQGHVAAGALASDTYRDVPGGRFDTWRRARGLPRVDWIKIDVEGAEQEVLEGMTETLAVTPAPQIVCETALGSDIDRLLTGLG
jgi:FkbM family methyltransferase